MKKVSIKMSHLLLAVVLSLAVGCNSSSSTEESATTSDSVGNSPGINTAGTIGGDSAGLINTPATNDANAMMTDTGFISKNIMDNMKEIELSKMGRDKGRSAQVKKVANQLITDHTLILNDLKTLAAKKQVKVPTHSTMAGDTSMMSSLQSTTGTDFDNSWAGQMLTLHQAKISELQNALNQTQDADIKAAINKALPKIQAHTQMLSKLPAASQKPQ
jgi:putative membrane protein